ncbi:MAG: glycoside hydrolase family 57 protein, partial [Gammaproteobacteria bacterium]|nr:glycoside hydrolase family 57 protein [Gammaproteobacteria bacterium]
MSDKEIEKSRLSDQSDQVEKTGRVELAGAEAPESAAAPVEKTKLVICWHMHQPNYVDSSTQTYVLPWTYLHAIKDYVDMAAHLEFTPEARAVVNFAPVLLEQLDDYSIKIQSWIKTGEKIADPMLDALVSEDVHVCFDTNKVLLSDCLRANEERLVDRYPHFKKIFQVARQFAKEPTLLNYLSEQFLADLLVWYNLAWMAETEKRRNNVIKELIRKEKNYTIEDRHKLVLVIGELIGGIVPRYRALAKSGQVELAFSPYAHPIIPLMLDFNSAKQASPEMPLPKSKGYPGGKERAEWHFRKGMEVFEAHFGVKASGCWPSEGGVSDQTIEICEKMGISWVASGESVLRNSLTKADTKNDVCIHKTYQLKNVGVNCYFRDDGLSDLIGFDYSTWHADDAINNLVHHIENISKACKDKKNTVISIIMDGENAWEYYPENGYYFLSQLYDRLSQNDVFDLATYAECELSGARATSLPHIVAGSWVYGTFSTWIGDADKNLGWDYLCKAKEVFDEVMASGRLNDESREAAINQLAICEGSDWFWWFGDYNPADS